ncbi:signal peptide peptidase SppA [Desulfovibrio inopinatus]|uniref:signal peptide peptidase SppA n=1 Tax=Desulfovibrio inopinatus TaxID=102109 RepID=UPI00040349B9|nr:signal peptide peptidase SppA [Desulfovibrio inopinatus]
MEEHTQHLKVTIKKGIFDYIKSIAWFGIGLLVLVVMLVAAGEQSETSDVTYYDAHFTETAWEDVPENATLVGLISLRGEISSKRSQDAFSSEPNGIDPESVRKVLSRIDEMGDIHAITVLVSSPGGQIAPSDSIWRQFQSFRQQKNIPLIFHTSDLMASGAYYFATAGDQVYASRYADVGSIGVLAIRFNAQALMRDKLGVDVTVYKTGIYKGMGNPFEPATQAEEDLIKSQMNDFNANFIDVVAKGRGLNADAVRQLATGRVWSGKDALNLGLVDAVLYRDELGDQLEKLLETTSPVYFVEYKTSKPILLSFLEDSGIQSLARQMGTLMSLGGASSAATGLKAGSGTLRYLYQY